MGILLCGNAMRMWWICDVYVCEVVTDFVLFGESLVELLLLDSY